jgi:hypothetical protein
MPSTCTQNPRTFHFSATAIWCNHHLLPTLQQISAQKRGMHARMLLSPTLPLTVPPQINYLTATKELLTSVQQLVGMPVIRLSVSVVACQSGSMQHSLLLHRKVLSPSLSLSLSLSLSTFLSSKDLKCAYAKKEICCIHLQNLNILYLLLSFFSKHTCCLMVMKAVFCIASLNYRRT